MSEQAYLMMKMVTRKWRWSYLIDLLHSLVRVLIITVQWLITSVPETV
jgi:hypothetical protein